MPGVNAGQVLENVERENRELRKMVWIMHGCEFGALYGDDGEMQCHDCRIDFKRDPVKIIGEKIKEKNLKKLPNFNLNLWLKDLYPTTRVKLGNWKIRRGSGTFVDSTTKLKVVGNGVAWAELEVVDPGESDCSKGTRFVAQPESIGGLFKVNE